MAFAAREANPAPLVRAKLLYFCPRMPHAPGDTGAFAAAGTEAWGPPQPNWQGAVGETAAVSASLNGTNSDPRLVSLTWSCWFPPVASSPPTSLGQLCG